MAQNYLDRLRQPDGLLSFLLMEYYIGLEGLRFLLLLAVCTLVAAGQTGWWRRLQHTLAHFALPLLVSMGFFYWRVAIFQGERLATDISAIAEDLAGSPALRGLWILVRLFQDMLNVLFVAWAEPLYRLAFPLRLKHFLLASGIGIVAAGLALLAVFLFFGSDGTGFLSRFSSKATGDHKGVDAQSASVQLGRSLPPGQLILLGLLAVAFALVPIHFGSRHVLFDGFSRFTLTASVGMAFFLSGMLAVISPRVRVGLAITLIGLAGMVHTANAIHYAENWEVVRNFWWQVSWRVPQIEPGTLLIASYADQGIAEDYFIWGPANLIYYPDQQTQLPITLTLTAATINTSDLYKVLSGGREERMRRGVYSEKDFSQVLVLSLPSPHACVHVLDSNRPELSIDDRAEISLLASVSDIGLVRLDETLMTPPAAIFGRPPAANWCFYYQKASLARQEGNWDEVSRLGNEAVAQGIRPYDWIEWLPFAQAYAYTGQPDRLHETAAVLRTEPIYLQEACELMRADVYRDADEYPEGHQQLIDELCRPLE